MTLSPPEREPKFSSPASSQQVSESGRILVGKKGWAVRITTISVMSLIVVFTIVGGMQLGDPLLIYSTLMPAHAILILSVGWFLYRNPAKGAPGNDLVSVIIPVYNQEGMIEIVVDSIYQSTYGNIEIIAVNDGSKDGTRQVLDRLAKKYQNLVVIHKKNEGKRKAVATGFFSSKGKYVILIDSDSVLDRDAISEMVKVFRSDPEVGGTVGHVKVWNADKNTLTKCQDAWYDFAFNIHKACESYFGSVTCCSGCLAGYRREIIMNFIPYWASARIHNSDDRELTSYILASKMGKEGLKEMADPGSFSKQLMESAARYDDSEDRVLTAQALDKWKTVYVATALVYTDVPEKLRGFLRQQERWKKGYLRTNFFVSSFFWQKRNPLMSLIYYMEFMTTFTAPLIVFTVLFYEPFVLKQYWYPVFLVGSLLLKGVAVGLDYKLRDPTAKNWIYKPLMNAITNFVLSWVLFPALWNFRKNRWLTR